MSLESKPFVTLIEERIKPYISKENKIVLALSGGVDSRVLLDVLSQLRWHLGVKVIAVHVHHGLSPYADQWSRLCQEWCLEAGIPLHIERVLLNRAGGDSLENVARQARYQVLQNYLAPADLLLTGHHQDDQLETFLLALKRGSGPKGLSSMAEVMPFDQGLIVRPLLMFSREQIRSYALNAQLDWIEDESNQDTRFDRNFIRHEIAPRLTERWPAFSQALQRSATLCAQQESLLDELLSEKLAQLLQEDGSLLIAPLLSLSYAARAQLLRMWLHRLGHTMPSRKQLDHLWQQVVLAQNDANPKLCFGKTEIRRFSGRLFALHPYQDIQQWQCGLPINESIELPDTLGTLGLYPVDKDKERSRADVQLSRLRMTLNSQALLSSLWVTFDPQGLQCCPFGRSGEKKLKKWFQEFGVPSWLRRRTPIVMCGEQVVAVAGLFVDRHFYGQDCELVWDKPDALCQNHDNCEA